MDAEPRPLGSKYQLVSEIGHGAMGEVWLGTDRDGNRVAVKLLLPHLAKDPAMVQRFVAERSVITGIRNEFLVDVRDMVVEGDDLGIVMEYVDGPDLRTYLKRIGTLSPQQVVLVGTSVARGLAALHARHVVHRDIKPENVLLDISRGEDQPPVPKITDFGIARLSDEAANQHRTVVVGTPYYMAPELVDGASPSAATDLYALGIMLYELTCGVTPFKGQATMAVLRSQAEREPGRPEGFPDALWNVVQSLLEKDPARRPSSADEVVRMLEAIRPEVASLPPMAALTTPPVGALVAREATTFVTPGPDATVLAMPGQSGFSGVPTGAVPGGSVLPGMPFATANPYAAGPQGTGNPYATANPYATSPGVSQQFAGAHVGVPVAQKKRHGGLVGAVVGLLVLAVAAVGFLVLHNRKQTPAASPANATVGAAAPAASPTGTPTATVTATAGPSAATTTTTTKQARATATVTVANPADQQNAARDSLEAAANSGDDQLAPMIDENQWVLQLSSKVDGTHDPEQPTPSIWHPVDIWNQYQSLKQQLAAKQIPVILAHSNTFGKQLSSTVYWSVLALDPNVTDNASGLAECSRLFPGKSNDFCTPREVTEAHS